MSSSELLVFIELLRQIREQRSTQRIVYVGKTRKVAVVLSHARYGTCISSQQLHVQQLPPDRTLQSRLHGMSISFTMDSFHKALQVMGRLHK